MFHPLRPLSFSPYYISTYKCSRLPKVKGFFSPEKKQKKPNQNKTKKQFKHFKSESAVEEQFTEEPQDCHVDSDEIRSHQQAGSTPLASWSNIGWQKYIQWDISIYIVIWVGIKSVDVIRKCCYAPLQATSVVWTWLGCVWWLHVSRLHLCAVPVCSHRQMDLSHISIW